MQGVGLSMCPNCGAPIEGDRCPYCGSRFGQAQFQKGYFTIHLPDGEKVMCYLSRADCYNVTKIGGGRTLDGRLTREEIQVKRKFIFVEI